MAELSKLVDAAKTQGWAIDRTARNHVVFSNGNNRVVTSLNASDSRAYDNCAAKLREYGLDIPRKRQKKKGKR